MAFRKITSNVHFSKFIVFLTVPNIFKTARAGIHIIAMKQHIAKSLSLAKHVNQDVKPRKSGCESQYDTRASATHCPIVGGILSMRSAFEVPL